MTKLHRTALELQDAIMHEVRRHPEWNDILSVSVSRRSRAASHDPNWDAAFTMDGPRVAPEGAFRLVTNLQNEFDLA
jgi:hypothetical protein